MTRAVIIRPAAEADLVRAVAYYQRVGHGTGFRAQLDSVIQRLVELPSSAPVALGDVRRALLRRYPYAVFYLVEPRRIVILAVLHQRRSPAVWPRPR